MNRYISLMELSQIKGVGQSIMSSVIQKLQEDDVVLEHDHMYDLSDIENTVINDDAFNVLSKIPANSIDIVVTDTPYWHNKGGNGGGHTKIATSPMYRKNSKVMGEMSDFGYDKLSTLLQQSQRVLRQMNFYAFCNDTLLAYYLYWATIHGYKYNVLVWEKPLSILNRERYSTNLEYIVRIYEDGVSLNKLDTSIKSNSYKYSKIKAYKALNKLHPTKKPNEYARDIIELSTESGDIVLDCFCGEGTFLVEAKKMGRNYIGVEWDYTYYQVAKQQLEQVEHM